MIKGSYDVHIHTSPDVSPRKESDLELADRIEKAGMAGAVVKCHFMDTSARAAVLNMLHPGLDFMGGVVLNLQAGGINPEAVERCGQMGGRYVWFPTMDSKSYMAHVHKNDADFDLSKFVYILDENDELIPEAVKVLEVAAKYNMAVGTGHISAKEGMALVPVAKEKGVRLILTHCDNPANLYTLEEQQKAVSEGAYVEHCFFTTRYKGISIEEIARQIRGVGIENVLLATDFGQMNSPFSDEGVDEYQKLLMEQGFTEEELTTIFCENPKKILK